MRIGLYGMPTAGKTFIMDRVDFLDVLVGSRLLREYDPDFDKRDEKGREKDRMEVAKLCCQRDYFMMDGHYAFGDETAFTEEEGEMYDRYLYIYVDPEKLRARMQQSEKNQKYLKFDISEWQQREIHELRQYCHLHNKDFYVLDCPVENNYADTGSVIDFLKDIVKGYSNVNYARAIADAILAATNSGEIELVDGDRTFIVEDSSSLLFDYKTHLFDGNFYTGYQSWKQYKEFAGYEIMLPEVIDVHRNMKVPDLKTGYRCILSSGNSSVWKKIASQFQLPVFSGSEMSAETKFFVVKFLREAGRKVIAYGDSMSDYYMLREANTGFLVSREDGRVSRSLVGKDLGGVWIV